jgi:hypothetical protein
MTKEMTQAARAELTNVIRGRYKVAVGKATQDLRGVHSGHRLSREVRGTTFSNFTTGNPPHCLMKIVTGRVRCLT